MSVLRINRKQLATGPAVFELGFRPFFVGAAFLGILSVGTWALVYLGAVPVPMARMGAFEWHSHEMIYGYTFAVIAGFLLTAVSNWTGITTLRGAKLAGLFSIWLAARVLYLTGSPLLMLAAGLDTIFSAGLFVALYRPIAAVRQWRQAGVLAKVLLLAVGNLCFYLGVSGYLERGTFYATHGGLYVIVALILTIASRVYPSFVENGVDYEVSIPNPPWIGRFSMSLYLAFMINQLFWSNALLTVVLSGSMFSILGWRLFHWHTPGIWRRPLLWGLFVALVFVDLGFLMFALGPISGISPFVAIHAFAFGGIGLSTLAMMSRVTLGHTGRSIRHPPAATGYALAVLTFGAAVRVVLPVLWPAKYSLWISASQALWIAAFGAFIASYGRMLFSPRVDGRPG